MTKTDAVILENKENVLDYLKSLSKKELEEVRKGTQLLAHRCKEYPEAQDHHHKEGVLKENCYLCGEEIWTSEYKRSISSFLNVKIKCYPCFDQLMIDLAGNKK